MKEKNELPVTSLLEAASAKIKTHDISGAYEMLLGVDKGEEDNAEIINLIARCHYIWGDFERAEECWEKAVQLNGSNQDAIASLRAFHSPSFQFWLKRYYEALNQVENKNYSNAREVLWELLQENDVFIGIYQLLGLCYLAESDKKSARKIWARGLELDLSNKPLLNYLNMVSNSNPPIREEIEVEKKPLFTFNLPRTRVAWVLSGVLCTALLIQSGFYFTNSQASNENLHDMEVQVKYLAGKLDQKNDARPVTSNLHQASFLQEEIINLNEENAKGGSDYDVAQEKWYYSEGYKAYLTGNWSKAISNLGTAVDMQSHSFRHREALYYLARVYYLNSDYANAEKHYLDYSRQFPDTNYYDESLFYLGCIYQYTGRDEKAREAFAKLQEIYPGSGYLSSKIVQEVMTSNKV